MMKFMLLAVLFVLTACSHGRSSFECPAVVGIGCESVSTVNQLINDGLLEQVIEGKNCKQRHVQKCDAAYPKVAV